MADKKELNPVVIGALKGCTEEAEVKDTFEKYSIEAQEARIDYLNAAMGDPKTFFAKNPAVDVRYTVTLRMFLAKTWQLAALYEKAGF